MTGDILNRGERLEWALRLPEHIAESLEIPVPVLARTSKIGVFGMGNSGIAGFIMKDHADFSTDVCLSVINDNTIPGWIDEDTTCIFISYTGDTMEIVEGLENALARGAKCIGISSGGALEVLCSRIGQPFIRVPTSCIYSRDALGHILGILASVLTGVSGHDFRSDLKGVLPEVTKFRDANVRSSLNYLFNLHDYLRDKVVALYAPTELSSVAMRWKMQLNENSGYFCFFGLFPEFNHNEIMAWAHEGKDRSAVQFLIKDNIDSDVNRICFSTSNLMNNKNVQEEIIVLAGSCNLAKILDAILLGDVISLAPE